MSIVPRSGAEISEVLVVEFPWPAECICVVDLVGRFGRARACIKLETLILRLDCGCAGSLLAHARFGVVDCVVGCDAGNWWCVWQWEAWVVGDDCLVGTLSRK